MPASAAYTQAVSAPRRNLSCARTPANARPIVRQLSGESSGAAFRRKRLYAVMVRFVVPVMMLILFLQSTGIMA